jgi:hypothetical protein
MKYILGACTHYDEQILGNEIRIHLVSCKIEGNNRQTETDMKFHLQYVSCRSRVSSVGIALGYGLDDWGFESRQGLGIFLLATASRQALGSAEPPVKWVPRREADHSPSSRTEFKNAWSYTPSPLYVLMVWYLFKHRDNFTFITDKEEDVTLLGIANINWKPEQSSNLPLKLKKICLWKANNMAACELAV